ncbi:CAP-Gly domain [Phytophthora infestans]|uniref:CAP-Gly domain n=1 Tax=Phytophthora infestans TaxID=4787 RepID=A0A8S9U1R5_PHYIN|nr:CAP-Gly domain [Phytophthora infestans]
MTAAQGMSPVMKVPLGSRVLLFRRRNGTVRYVGKLVNESGEWYGVALDEPKGDCDGMKGKERYFQCPTNHGIFVRRKEINYVKEPGNILKGPPSPVSDDSSSNSSNVSADQQEANSNIVHPASTNTDHSTSPTMRTFKGFRKQLDFISLKTTGSGRSRESSPLTSPVSSSPSSPTARSGLKPPSPFRRFSSFSQGLPIPGSSRSPTTTITTASPESIRRESLSSKPSPVRRANSFRVLSSEDNEASIRTAETTSPSSQNRFGSYQFSPVSQFALLEETADTSVTTQDAVSTPSASLNTIHSQLNEILPAEFDATQWKSQSVAAPTIEDERNDAQVLRADDAQIYSSQLDSSPPATPSPESTPNRIGILNGSKASPTRNTVPGPLSKASAFEPRVSAIIPPRSPRARHEVTAVESLSPDKKLVDDEAGSGERPLFFRLMNVGRSPIERRSSCSSFSNSSPSPPKLPISSSTANAATRSSRVEELEREISVMRSSHENIVAVLRATNQQHAANVLELRAQVAALTEGNLLLERQLTAKCELVRELREMEKQQQRDTVSVSEVHKILEIKDTQIQTLEREMAQLRQRLTRLESDKDSQLYKQFQHYESRRERDEKRINELRKEVLAMVRPLTFEILFVDQCNERLELQTEVRDLKEMSLRFF